MISFCDIPITLLDEHTSRYGVYGIGLSKDWGIKRGVTPTMYIANDAVLRSAHYHIMNDFKLTEMVNYISYEDYDYIEDLEDFTAETAETHE